MPSPRILDKINLPKENGTIRINSDFRAGDEVSMFYDPTIAKLIYHGETRVEALDKLRDALETHFKNLKDAKYLSICS